VREQIGHVKPVISRNGRFVAFQSDSTDLVPGNERAATQVFVLDRKEGAFLCASVDPAGKPGDWISFEASISADGRYVAFASHASNLASGDTNASEDVFLHDRNTGKPLRISGGPDGGPASGGSRSPSLSGDGSRVAFVSTADDLVPADTNGAADVFLYDLKKRKTTRVSVSSSKEQADAGSGEAAISQDGRFVAFYSHASNLEPGDTNGKADIFLHEVSTGITRPVSESSSGGAGNGDSRRPALSADGRFVAFESWATNLVPGDTNNAVDIFLRDLRTGTTEIVSLNASGKPGNGDSRDPRISDDGRFVLFTSFARDMVPDDTRDWGDVFLHDRESKSTKRVSVASDGSEGNHESADGSLSGDGRYVVFSSKASNLVPYDNNKTVDVFLHDCRTGRTTRLAPPPPASSQQRD
jgi:Tol biopolymer transport system component